MITFSIIGSVLIALAYMLLSLNIVKDQSKTFFYLLLVGNISFIVYSIYKKDYPVLFLNIGFTFFAVMAIFEKTLKLEWVNIKLFMICILMTIAISIHLNQGHVSWFMETVGWFSTVAGFGSYLLYSQKKINLFMYFFINMIVNFTFSTYLYFNHNYPYMGLQMFVFCFSAYGVIRLSRDYIKHRKLLKYKHI